MDYVPHTSEELRRMFEAVGLTEESLFSDIPDSARLREPLPLPAAEDEMALRRRLSGMAGENAPAAAQNCFLGGGVYDHFVPAAVSHLSSLPAFLTAYTPYQPEVSQGTLTAIFEYQTMICELTGLDVSNASMYDGASAAAEAMLLATASKRRSTVLIPFAMHPDTKATIKTYASFRGITVKEVPYDAKTGRMTPCLADLLDDDTAAVFVQSPNYFGVIEEMGSLADQIKAKGAMAIAYCDPLSLALLTPPGKLGYDIAVGDCQSIGLPMNFGGPSAGYMASSEALTRKMPGRIVGETTDTDGKRAFVLTLQAREQHIRRERATSNICSNQANAALAVTIHLSLLGREGLREAAELSAKRAWQLKDALLKTGKFEEKFGAPFFREFVLTYKGDETKLLASLRDKGILGGLPLVGFCPDLKAGLLIAATEKRTTDDINAYAKEVAAL